MAPAMRALRARGVGVRAVSLAELRGLETRPIPVDGIAPRRAIPARIRRSPSVGASFGVDGTGAAGRLRRVAQAAVWAALAPRLAHLLRGADRLVVPNDAAYPYDRLVRRLARGRRLVLVQEGIRFPLPGDRGDDAYGAGGADAICAWGEASAAYFRARGAPAGSIRVTGTPRFDALDVARWREAGVALRARLGLAASPLVFLSNPVDDQGFCTPRDKLALFRGFLDRAAPALAAADVPVVVKLHPREDAAAFRAAAAASAAAGRARIVEGEPLHAILGAARAAVVLASTVGLEALLFGLPLGVLELPGHGHVFDYVARGVAAPLPAAGPLDAALAPLLAGAARGDLATYLDHHLAHRGEAAARVADAIVGTA
jgi:hypothetical protein